MPRTWSELLGLASCTALMGGCGGEPVNGCDPASALDSTGALEVEIGFGGVHGYDYVPACLRVRVGTRLRFVGPFEVHPLGAGSFGDGGLETALDGPIRVTASGDEASFLLTAPGSYGFFCHNHVAEGMAGAVFVE